MAALPVRLRQNIRDLIDSPTSSFAQKTAALKETLGYHIVLDTEWPMLWETLKPYYSDPSSFIPSVTNILIAWCDAFSAWLENSNNEEDVENILEILSSFQMVKIVIENSSKSSRPSTCWDTKRGAFVIDFPKSEAVSRSTAQAGFSGDLLNLFKPSSEASTSNRAVAVEDPDAWAELTLDSPDVNPARSKKDTAPISTSLPDISTIERPEELTKRSPYWLMIRQESRYRIVVEGTHGPSLTLIEGYLKKWCRGNIHRVDRPPIVQISLQESVFGLGLMHDALVIEAERGRELNVTLLLPLVETVLEYVPVGNGYENGQWTFKRLAAFR
ncbi:hypothetical protein B0O99DRAFT_688267 [Bisporella sp. PMI_857]|nr:hypothetical protein B0O99DRAFT_688267 [Bisporella sp. PMI_857]